MGIRSKKKTQQGKTYLECWVLGDQVAVLNKVFLGHLLVEEIIFFKISKEGKGWVSHVGKGRLGDSMRKLREECGGSRVKQGRASTSEARDMKAVQSSRSLQAPVRDWALIQNEADAIGRLGVPWCDFHFRSICLLCQYQRRGKGEAGGPHSMIHAEGDPGTR